MSNYNHEGLKTNGPHVHGRCLSLLGLPSHSTANWVAYKQQPFFSPQFWKLGSPRPWCQQIQRQKRAVLSVSSRGRADEGSQRLFYQALSPSMRTPLS